MKQFFTPRAELTSMVVSLTKQGLTVTSTEPIEMDWVKVNCESTIIGDDVMTRVEYKIQWIDQGDGFESYLVYKNGIVIATFDKSEDARAFMVENNAQQSSNRKNVYYAYE